MFTIIGADGKEYGPVTAGKLHEWIAGGRANLQTKARRGGDPEWKTLGDFSEFGEFGATAGGRPPTAPPLEVAASETASPLPAEPGAPPADLSLRFLAALIDGILKTVCYLPISLALFHVMLAQAKSGEQPSFVETTRMMTAVFDAKLGVVLPMLGVLVLVQLFLLAQRGQSVGKLLLGLRIIRLADSSTAGFLHAFLLRGTIPFIIEQIPLLGLGFWLVDCCFIFREDRRCVHDLLAGTMVVKA